jgi:hypothetical protein
MNNVNVKSALIIVTTLIIGIAIGFELSEISIKKKFERMDSFKGPQGFTQIFEDIIKPDDSQKDKVNTILLKYHDKIDKVMQSNMSDIALRIDSMAVELNQILNTDQKTRLDEEMQRMKRMPMPPKMDGGPFPKGKRMPPPDMRGDDRGPMPPAGDRNDDKRPMPPSGNRDNNREPMPRPEDNRK